MCMFVFQTKTTRMRKVISFLIALAIAGMTALWADVATPNPVKMKQPDGSTITLRLHGDEFHSWYTSEDGKTVYKRDSNGWWKASSGPRISSRQLEKAKAMRAERDRMIARNSKDGLGLGFGSNHFLIILVQWKDQQFQDGASDYFKRALAETGFSDNGSVGSAKDYYTDASNGQFTPNFDVYGPITLERNHNEWPEEDPSHHYIMARTMIQEAVSILDETVDLSQYDNNGDGYIDNVYMFYPGYAQSNGGGEDTIWPHAWAADDGVAHDGVYIGSYACSSELNGNEGTVLNGIGTFCHEFGHVIGLPDLYDTDYETNGEAFYPASWNLMASGNHNASGRIPARLSSYERYLLGYITTLEDLSTTSGNKTIENLSENRAFILPTPNKGEFFLLEARDGQKWDSPLPEGMLIYHIDRSANLVAGQTAAERWDSWSLINGYGEHPCYYILIPDPSLTIYGYYSITGEYFSSFYDLWTFPSSPNTQWGVSYNVTEYEPEAWDGSRPWKLSNISYSDGKAYVTVGQGERSISGSITDKSDGEPVEGAYVIVSVPQSSSRAPKPLSLASARSAALYETVTDSEGTYKIVLSDEAPTSLVVSVFATGYLPEEESVTGVSIHKDFSLTPIINLLGNEVSLTKTVFPITSGYAWGYNQTGQNYTVAQKFTASEISHLAGGKIKAIQYGCWATGEEIWVFVDFGTTNRVLARKVENPSDGYYARSFGNTVDVSDANITIPKNTDIYIGYMVKNADNTYIVYTDSGPAADSSFLMYYDFSTTEAGGNNWVDVRKDWNWGAYNSLIAASVEPTKDINPGATLSDMGFSYINIPSGTLTAGSTMPLKIESSKSFRPQKITWYMDGVQIDGDSVTLTAGKHVVCAKLEYFDDVKTEDKLEVRINVQ